MTTQTPDQLRFRGRSFPLLSLEPEAPLDNWMHQLDACLKRSPSFFARKSIVVDVSALGLDRPGCIRLVESLSERGIRIMGLAGAEPAWAADDFPPILAGARARPEEETPKPAVSLTADERANFDEIARTLGARDETKSGQARATIAAVKPVPLIVHSSVRSGQSVSYPEGDVTVIGAVSSGADVVAGGSVHVYGTIRGRVIAGAFGDRGARIFCRRNEAELLAIGGVYLTADAMEAQHRGCGVHAWLDQETVKLAKLD